MKTYIFDLDGTLVDSMSTWAGVYIKLLDEHSIPYPDDIVKIITPLGNKGAANYCTELGLNMTAKEITEHNHSILLNAYSLHLPEKPNVSKALGILKASGASLNVLTASPHQYIDPCLKRLGIYNLFDKVWSIDDFGHTKGEEIIYHKAAERLDRTTDECIFVDDNYTAIATAVSAGMKTIGIYDKSSHDYETQIREVAHAYVHDFGEIPNIEL